MMMKTALFLAVYCAWLSHVVAGEATWQSVLTQNKPNARHEAAFVECQGRFYLLGGRGVKPVNIFDPATNIWSAGAQPPVEIHHVQPVTWNGRIYLAGALTGGFPGETPLSEIQIYDPATNVWSTGTQVPIGRRRGSTGVVVHQNLLYLVCGIIDGHRGGNVPWLDALDLATGQWTQLANAPRARDHFNAAVVDGKIYAVGGRLTQASNAFGLTIPEVDVYDIATNTWSTLPASANLPTPRAGSMTAVHAGEVIIAGGESQTQTAAHKEVEALSTSTKSWRTLSPMVQGRHGTGLISFQNALWVAAGCGQRGGSPELDSTERLALTADAPVNVSGELKQWHPVTITVPGPNSSETSTPNPFRDYRLDVTFTAPDGATRTVPGYYAADGNAGETGATSGAQWQAHMTPDLQGTWSYVVSFKTGTNVAINGGGTPAGNNDGARGTFTVGASDKTGADFRAPDKGQLDYVGEHALRWRGAGGRFFKTAMNHPELFLEYQDFDNTTSTRTYASHVANWATGDPTWQGTKGKGIIGVVNYLASQGVNEHYFLTMNSRGDGKQTFPWTASETKWNYDVSKLAQWGLVFDHMMRKGVMPQLVLEECENQLLFEVLDGTPAGGLADSRKLYYREMAARFGHLNAVIWNIGEENGWDQNTPAGEPASDAQRKSRATFLRGLLTPQAHIVVHNGPSDTDAIFTTLVGHPSYSGISFQGNLSDTGHGNGRIGHWHTQSRNAGRPWVIAYDEPYVLGAPSRDDWRKNALWACLTGGGTGAGIYSSSDLSLQNYTAFAPYFGDMRRAQTFLSDNAIPYWEMIPNNSQVSTGWCLATTGTYVIYLPGGGTTNLTAPAGTYTVDWFDPRNDVALVRTANLVSTGVATSIGNPPSNSSSDWVVLVRSVTTK